MGTGWVAPGGVNSETTWWTWGPMTDHEYDFYDPAGGARGVTGYVKVDLSAARAVGKAGVPEE
jgi:hypothetical protein